MSDNPERVSFPFHLGGPGTLTDDKQFSIYVSRTLDCVGKSPDMVKYRVKKHRELQDYFNIMNRGSILEINIAGSKAEGLTSISESDLDYMFVIPNIICAENVRPFIHSRYTTVFQTNRHYLHAGYTKLKLVDSSRISVINDSLIQEETADKYLSSDSFVSTVLQLNCNANYIYRQERCGPAIAISDIDGSALEDRVFAFLCICPSILQSFLTRPRPHNRPSINELRDISVMDAHVVPVGYKESNESHNEWRVCYTRAEIYLVQILNETETKLYIILKMVSKLLKFISKDITSYVMKNIVLWLVELYPENLFKEDLLTYQLIQALRFLQKCVIINYLPSYIIPARNLLSGRLDPTQRLQLTTFMSTLIKERGHLLLRCEQIRNGMTILYREPDMTDEFRKRRDIVEKLWLLTVKITCEKEATTGLSAEEVERLMYTEGTHDTIFQIQINALCPDIRFLLRQGRSAEVVADLTTERFKQILS